MTTRKKIKVPCCLCGSTLVRLPKKDTYLCTNAECSYYYRTIPEGYAEQLSDGIKAEELLAEIVSDIFCAIRKYEDTGAVTVPNLFSVIKGVYEKAERFILQGER